MCGHAGSTHIAAAEEALSSALNGKAGNIAAFALDFVRDHFDFEHWTRTIAYHPQPSHWLPSGPARAIRPSAGHVGIDNLSGLPHLGAGTSNADPVHNQASDSFAFNSAFSENGTGGSETAQIVEQSDQTVLQTVSDMFAHAAHASPETIGPIGEGVATITGVEHDKVPTDFLLHG